MRTLNFTQELIQEYYHKDFAIDFWHYFDVKPMVNHREIAFIGHLDWHFNPDRKCNGEPAFRYSLLDYQDMQWQDFQVVKNQTEKNFIFAGIFYFLVLVPQTLRKMFGEDVEYDFYRCTGWPLVSAGLGGYLPPKQMLEEASLFPCEVERENFHRMLVDVCSFMIDELRGFFMKEDRSNLNNTAYNRMLNNMSSRVEDFLSKIEKLSTDFTRSFEV